MTGHHLKGPQSLQPKAAVRAFFILFPSPILNGHACPGKCPELLPVETPGSEPRVEALDEAILPWAPRLNEERLDSGFFQPYLEFPIDELASIVTSDVLECTVDIDRRSSCR
ncbi:MAG: hypothetical protein VXX36_02880 [Verrucomicrobiota bacterium]|nr:hypothetical protein [Verrucomicrobiota bacterium]